ncbi:MAG: hypothetical protein JW885_01150 [Deltaproteobacteria bacterium]|nr:hypothetical protein [Candidatus Zymogenaceae bacterium]
MKALVIIACIVGGIILLGAIYYLTLNKGRRRFLREQISQSRYMLPRYFV